jgi:hypothetical protein
MLSGEKARAEGNPLEIKIRPPGTPAVALLPEQDGHLSGGGVMKHATKGSSMTVSSFRFSQEGLNLSRTAGMNVPFRSKHGLTDGIREIVVTLSVEEGRVRVYLGNPGTFGEVEQDYGGTRFEHIPGEGFVHATAAPDQPCTLRGNRIRRKHSKKEIVFEALDGSARGISYVITNG